MDVEERLCRGISRGVDGRLVREGSRMSREKSDICSESAVALNVSSQKATKP